MATREAPSDERSSGTEEALGRYSTPRVEKACEAYLHCHCPHGGSGKSTGIGTSTDTGSNFSQTCPIKTVESLSDAIRAAACEITSSTQDKISQFAANVLPSRRI